MKAKLEMLDQSMGETRYKIEEELFTKNSYMHMLDRMKKDFIAAKLLTTDHEKSLKNKYAIMDEQLQKQRKTKEERLQAKSIFENLLKHVEKEQRDRQERIFEL